MNRRKRFSHDYLSKFDLSGVHKNKNKYIICHKENKSEIINPVLAGYWFEWTPRIDLAVIPNYNIFIVAFMNIGPGGIPTFSPSYMTDEQFIAAVDMLKCQGREVLISLGGAGYNISLTQDDKQEFIRETIRVFDKYGFTGMDIDLEDSAMTAADNQTVIPEALIEIKNHYINNGRNFMITMAPEFPYLRKPDGPYVPYIQKLEGYYDIIFPQYYNQGADGIWSYELNMWLSNNNDEYKAEFLYTLTNAIVTGTQNFIQIPADKFAIGLPASPSAAFNGYVINPGDVIDAFSRLDREGNCIRGLMTWSINQDAANGYRFASSYMPLVFGRCIRCGYQKSLDAPQNLRAVSTAKNSIGLEWDANDADQQISGYIICRDCMEIGRVNSSQTSFLDTGLCPDTEYRYTVKSFDEYCNFSEPSNILKVSTGGNQRCN